jgi:UDP-glucose 4-epimerase
VPEPETRADGAETTGRDDPTVAVTGAAGYIGSRVVDRLVDAHPEWEVVGLDDFSVGDVGRVAGVDIADVDVRDRDALEAFLDGADVVMHLAAVSGVEPCDEQPDLAYESNVVGTNNVAWFCRKTDAALVFPFSMAAVGDPESFPITVDAERDPLNWYGRTKLLGEHAVQDMAEGAFPAHCYLISNLYGEHTVEGRTVTKGTVINFFVNRVFDDGVLPVYEPGTQSRNYVHVDDVAKAYVRSAERLLDARRRGEMGVTEYEIATDEDPSVMELAELVRSVATEEADRDVTVELVENPRSEETLVQEFGVDLERTRRDLDWEAEHTVEETIRELVRAKAEGRETPETR